MMEKTSVKIWLVSWTERGMNAKCCIRMQDPDQKEKDKYIDEAVPAQ